MKYPWRDKQPERYAKNEI